jgi:hypothetical protein
MTTLADLMTEASKDGRVCPQPMIWNQLWELLPDRRRVGAGWEPPLPLILAAWWEASDSDKRSRSARDVAASGMLSSTTSTERPSGSTSSEPNATWLVISSLSLAQ